MVLGHSDLNCSNDARGGPSLAEFTTVDRECWALFLSFMSTIEPLDHWCPYTVGEGCLTADRRPTGVVDPPPWGGTPLQYP